MLPQTEDLPERKIPGHDGQDDPEWLECHEALASVGRDDLGLQEGFSLLGVVFAYPGALLCFGPPFLDRLAHFLRHEDGVGLGVLAENVRGALHQARAFGKRGLLPVQKGLVSLGNDLANFGRCHLFVCLNGISCGGIHGAHSHSVSSSRGLMGARFSVGTVLHKLPTKPPFNTEMPAAHLVIQG
jgi:hypothetical protein